MKPVPKYIAKQYVGGAHGFRAEKRRQVRALKKALGELRPGCASFPSGTKHVYAIGEHVDALLLDLSVKHWGQ